MARYGFKIVRDYLYEADIIEYGESEVDVSDSCKGEEVEYNGGTVRCRVYDGDGELYYEALCDGDKGAERFHNWAERDSGIASSTIKDNDEVEWKDFIG
jgi:hypothetical protein